MATLLETVYQESATTVGEDGVLRGVKLLGINSRNGRRYEAAALKKAGGLYEGRKVYVDHPQRESAGEDRSFADWAGVIENVKYRKDDGLYGDIVLRKESEHFRGIVEAASHPKFHKSCGFSHVAEGESHFDGDTEIIESIKEVFSVDLVTDPATTAGMFESTRKKPKTIKQALESLPEGTIRTKLIEMMAGYGLDMGMDGDSKSDPHAQLGSIIQQLVNALTETLHTLAAVKEAPPAAAPPAPPAPPAEPEAEDEDVMPDEQPPKEQPPEFESLQRELSELKAKTLLLESGREATPARIKALAVAAEDDRKELLESWPAAESIEKPFRSPPANINGEHIQFDFSQPGSFAARYS